MNLCWEIFILVLSSFPIASEVTKLSKDKYPNAPFWGFIYNYVKVYQFNKKYIGDKHLSCYLLVKLLRTIW